jgi:hypothetical protein
VLASLVFGAVLLEYIRLDFGVVVFVVLQDHRYQSQPTLFSPYCSLALVFTVNTDSAIGYDNNCCALIFP